MHVIRIIAFAIVMTSLSVASLAADDFKAGVLGHAAAFEKDGELRIGKHTINGPRISLRMFELNEYRPIWSDASLAGFTAAVKDVYNDGLNRDDYLFDEFAGLGGHRLDGLAGEQRVALEFLLSEAYIRALYNLKFGKVDPQLLDPDVNFTEPFSNDDPATSVLKTIREMDFAGAFSRVRPQNHRYQDLKDQLTGLRSRAAAGGWPSMPDGPTLKPGESGARVRALAARLAAGGDYEGGATDVFDDALEAAVKRFQERHGLDVDGAIGPQTVAALNVAIADRIDQVRVNLERQRWYLHEAHGEFIVVDIAGFRAFWVRDDEIIWEEQVQVGKFYTKTPIFKDHIRYLDFNPTWTIPPGIMRRSILPNLKKDPGYLDKKGYHLLTRDGERLDAKQIDWSSIKGFPYIVRQPPGPNNALGLVKFMFPNPHYVFLHDTNHRELFAHTSRGFSSGCIRVRNPFDLAERLLADQKDWTRARIDAVVASGKTTTVRLTKPMRIVIAYNTATVRDGALVFKPDVYKRDPAVLEALDGKFKVRKRDREQAN